MSTPSDSSNDAARIDRGKLLKRSAGIALGTSLYSIGDPLTVLAAQMTPKALKPDGDLAYFNWAQYINPKLLSGFEKEYKVKVNESNFTNMENMLAKLRAGVKYDVAFPEAQTAAQLVKANFLAPLDHSKHHELVAGQLAPFHNPWYDAGAKYTVPYAIWTTGIAWRTDKVKGMTGSWNDLFNHPEAAKHTYLLDDMREVIGMGLLDDRHQGRQLHELGRDRQGPEQGPHAQAAPARVHERQHRDGQRHELADAHVVGHRLPGAARDEAPGDAALPDQQGRHPGRQRHDGACSRTRRTRTPRSSSSTGCCGPENSSANVEYIGYPMMTTSGLKTYDGLTKKYPWLKVTTAEVEHGQKLQAAGSEDPAALEHRLVEDPGVGRGTTRCDAASGRASSFRRASGSSRSTWSRSGLIVAASFGTVDFLGRVIYSWPFAGWDLSNYHTVLVVGLPAGVLPLARVRGADDAALPADRLSGGVRDRALRRPRAPSARRAARAAVVRRLPDPRLRLDRAARRQRRRQRLARRPRHAAAIRRCSSWARGGPSSAGSSTATSRSWCCRSTRPSSAWTPRSSRPARISTARPGRRSATSRSRRRSRASWRARCSCSCPPSGDFANAEFLGSPDTSMIGNVINGTFNQGGYVPLGGTLTVCFMVGIAAFMVFYLRSAARASREGAL